MEILNWKLLTNPLNWLTVFLMLFIAGIALHLALSGLGISSAGAKQASGAVAGSLPSY